MRIPGAGGMMVGVYRSAARLPNRPFFQRKRNQSCCQDSCAREVEKRVVELHIEKPRESS